MIKFNDILDKIGMKELSDDLVVKINNAGQAAITKLNEHINDSTVHVTSTEKDNWNSKAPNHSPNFTGEPTAPTTVQSTNNDQIATTRYVTEKINAWVPDVANEAKKLVSKNNFSIKGAITSSVQSFDGTGNVVLVVDNVPTRSLAGIIDPLNLDGTYNISITGTAGSANNASSLGGVLAKDFAKLESPTFTGKPKAPTAEAGDSSMQIANTNYVTNAINAIHFPEDVKTAEKLKNPVTFKISGKVISNEVVFDGSENVDLKVTTVNIQDQLDAYMPTKVNNHTVDSDVPVNAVFTDTVYTHPDTVQDLTGKSYTQVVVDRQGHVVYGANPDNLAVSIAGNAATATKLANTFKIKLTGDAVTTDATGVTDGQNDATLALDSINANAIATDRDHRLVTDDEKANYLDKYTKAEMDAKLERFKLDSGFDIIGSSDTEEDIATDFPHPVDGNVVVVKSTGLLYRFNGVSWRCMAEYTLVTKTKNGMMSAVDKVKLDGIEEGANNYTLPDKLPASMITEDESRKFITFDEKTKLDNLYTKEQIDQQITSATPEASVDKAGLLSAADKIKLDSIETGANRYVLPKTLPASIMTEDEDHRFTTDTEKASYADKYTKVEVNTLISNATPLASHTVNGLMRSTDKVKLDGIEEGANNYTLPDELPASMITEDETHQFVTSTDKTVYADKFTKAETRDAIAKATPIVTTGTAGLMTAADKAKLDGIAANANNYVLPSTLPASMITEDVNHRFVTDQDKSDYADKYTKVEVEGLINAARPEIVTKEAAGLMSASDKAKLDGIEANANKYVLPKTLPATMITEDKDHRFVTDLEKTTYLDKYTKNETIDLIDAAKPGVVTQEFNGLMSSTDKTKLDGIAEGANNYVLPDTLPASMIVPDEQHQFVNLTEKASYADKYTKAETQNLITTSIQNANTDGMIWQKDVNSFSDIATTYPDPKKGWTVSVNDTGKIYRYNGTEWVSLSGSGSTYQLATQTEDGLMAATDKTKLDGIEAGANNYVLPKTLPANMITTTDDKQFISSVEKTSYADKYTKAEVTNLIKEARPANATTAAAGLMSAADKAKLDGIEANANRYTLPNDIPASMIETSDDLQFVSQTEKTSYADKYTKAETVNLINQHVPDVVTTRTNGLMIAADKVKLDGIEANANHYVLPETLPASMITEDETHKFITTAEKAKIANSYNKDEIIKIVSEATPSASDTKAGLMSAADKAKLDGIAANANNYVLPATLPASMITTTADKQFISNTEKTSYADKYTKAEVDQKLTDIASGNINLSTYTRYKGHISRDQITGFEPYSGKIEKDDLFFQGNGLIIITKAPDDSSTVPEYQRLSTLSLVDSSAAGLMSTADKSKLDGIEAGANNYKLPSTLPASMIAEDTSRQFVTPAEHTKLKNLANATTTVSGLMSSTDKTKLDGIEAGANHYVLPETLPASMITEDNTHKFVTADEKTKLSQVYTKAETDNAIKTAKVDNATTTKAGLMSAADKAKLDGIAANANKYVLPSTLPASMIEQSESLKFVSSAEKTKIGNTYTKTESDARYLTKVDSHTDKLEIGTGWEIKPNSDGNLEILYNGVVKTTISTDGKMLAPSIIEGSSLTGTGVTSLNDLINTKEDKTSHDADISSLRTSLATKAASTDLNTKVYTRASVTNNISSFPANTGIFLIEEPDTITIPS